MKITCDSDVLASFGRGRGRGALEVREAIAKGSLVLNAITSFETRGGMERPDLVADFDQRLGHLPVLALDRAAVVRAGDLWRELRRRKKPIVVRDLLMAAIADANRTRLVTADRDFEPLLELGLDVVIVTTETHA